MDPINITSIFYGLIAILLAIIGWFVKRGYLEIVSWRKEINDRFDVVTKTLYKLDKRIYRVEMAVPAINKDIIDRPVDDNGD